MTQIASEDYENKRIYLHADTEVGGWSPLLMQQEHRTLRRLNANGERGFDIMVTFSGKTSKGNGKFTPNLTNLRSGVRVIPYDPGSGTFYNLDILDECLNIEDAVSDREVIDRATILTNVNVDPTYSPVEVQIVTIGSGVLPSDVDDIVDGVFDQVMEDGESFAEAIRLIRAIAAGNVIQQSNGEYVIKSKDGVTDRIEGEKGPNKGRVITNTDSS